jgi:dTDP-4-dehydrorhamnose reductase
MNSVKSVLITGGAGLLGSTLIRLAPPGLEVHATRRTAPVNGCASHPVELSDASTVSRLLEALRPTLVIHTAYSMAAGERDIWQATRSVVAACRRHGAELLYLSTDALLDGENAPYAEDAEPDPVHEYGRWKARAERHVREEMPGAAVIRTSLITAVSPLDPRSAWVAESLREGREVTLFVDEFRCPIAVEDLAFQLWEIAALPPRERGGVWHLAGPEALSRYTLGALIAAREGLDAGGIRPGWSRDAPSPRPRDLRLLTTRADRTLRTRARPISALMWSAGG